MNEEEFYLLTDFIEALIDEKIKDTLGQDSLAEGLKTSKLKMDVINVLVYGEKLEDEDD